jgi:ribonucleoside-triphosphate reductase (thioredoxin)
MKYETPWSSVGYLTFKRTYAWPVEGENRKEEFEETVERVINACNEQLGCNFDEEEQERLREYFLTLKGSVAGRFLWQLGSKTVDKIGLASLQNCAFTKVDQPIRPFTWTMDMLALGSGVGYNIQRKYVDNLPPVKEWFKAPTRVDHGGADFIIPDSREGWVKFLGKTLKAAFLSETPEKGTFTYSTQVIRGKGTPIKGFGGVASGPEDLCIGIQQISDVLRRRRGRKIRPIDALDVMNIIGSIIVAGNVRRSAQIAIGDPDDVEFLLAKRWDMGNIPPWRDMSNNSVVCNDLSELHEFFWGGYEGRGEPYGLINLELAKKIGRLGDTQYPDPEVEGFNPCAEQSLASFETCCLSEVFLPNVTAFTEFLDILELLYRINKHSLLLESHHPETTAIVHKNMRMGIGLTGVLQASEEQLSWLEEGYQYLRDFDDKYSREIGVTQSVKLTTVKPSGTLSLLPGVTPGAHPGYAQYMLRRIRMSSSHELVQLCRDNGYPVEYALRIDGSEDYNTVVVTFPFRYPEGTKLAKDCTAVQQLEVIRMLQGKWSDNSVSCTIYYKIEELPEIKAYLKDKYKNTFKTLSFVLHKDHGFAQTPYEEITKEEYDALVAKVKPIHRISDLEMDYDDQDCLSGACPVK